MKLSLILPLTTLMLASVTNAQSTFLVYHDFDVLTGGLYTNGGSTGVINDGLPNGNVTQSPGISGFAATLGGIAGDEIVSGFSPLTGNAVRTVSIWARTTTTAGIVTSMTFGTNGNGSKWDMDIDCASGGVFELGVGGGRTVGSGPALNDGQWHLMTTVLPVGGTAIDAVRLFVDGAYVYGGSGNTGRAIATGTGDLVVGRSANVPTIQPFPGDVDDLVIWSEPFTDEQVQSLYDVATHPSLAYPAYAFEQLLEVFRGNLAEVTLGGKRWRAATGLTGGPGLTTLVNGGFELVFDAVGNGVRVVQPASVTTFGTGCPGGGGRVPAIGTTGLPVIGTTSSVDLVNGCPGCPAALLLGVSRIDLALGFGCTLYPLPSGITLNTVVSGTGTASIPATIPMDRFLIGANMFAQWVVLDPNGAFGPNVASASDGLQMTVGDA
ncbi:MAG: LamG domain-containing protein [Planctomycetes bacterium]|nr:LamG domain-containing protein [Planctomycetota bacterium]MCB9891919.1 LamG domain-containing protein [Planctomycetota bacterium]